MREDIVFLFSQIQKDAKLVIYGAGEIGRYIINYINSKSNYELVAWVDTNWKQFGEIGGNEIQSPYRIKELNYDYIIIATKNYDWIIQMKTTLMRMAVPNDKIVSFDLYQEKYKVKPEKLRCISLLDTGISSMNMGDCIIMNSIETEMDYLFKNYFITHFSSHMPIALEHQITDNFRYNFLKSSKYTFLCGTDLLEEHMDVRIPQWNVDKKNCSVLNNVILLGVGSSTRNKTNHFDSNTKELLTQILSRDFIHSVRDEKARIMLKEIGIEAVNTSCPTLWGLNSDFCQYIPKEKAESVVFSISEFRKEVENDIKLVELLRKNYNTIYFWAQAYMDYNYLKSHVDLEGIQVIKPNLSSYRKILQNEDVDYIGTRLHGGIFAMQYGKRTIILGIDARAQNMYKDVNINYIPYGDFELLDRTIHSSIKTEISLPTDKINFFKKQFK